MKLVATDIPGLKLELERVLSRLDPIDGPTQVYACASTALPSPATNRNAVIRVTDLDILAVSNGAAWIRQDTGAAI